MSINIHDVTQCTFWLDDWSIFCEFPFIFLLFCIRCAEYSLSENINFIFCTNTEIMSASWSACCCVPLLWCIVYLRKTSGALSTWDWVLQMCHQHCAFSDVVMVRTQALENDPKSVLKWIIYLSLAPQCTSDLICPHLERYV